MIKELCNCWHMYRINYAPSRIRDIYAEVAEEANNGPRNNRRGLTAVEWWSPTRNAVHQAPLASKLSMWQSV